MGFWYNVDMTDDQKLNFKKVYRSDGNRVLAGVLGGLGEYFEVDPVLLRILFILLTIFTGVAPGIIAYLLMIAVIPRQRS